MEEDSQRPSLPRRVPGASAIKAPPPVRPPVLPKREPGASGRQATGPEPRPLSPPAPDDDEAPTAPQPAIQLPVSLAGTSPPAAGPAAVSEPAAPSQAPARQAAAGETTAPAPARRTPPVPDTRTAPAPAGLAKPPPRTAPARPRKALLRRRWVLCGLVILVLGGSVAGTSVLSLASRDGTHSGGTATGAAAFKAEARARAAAAVWVAREVSKTAMVSCDPSMCLALEARGKPAASLLVERPPVESPLRSAVIIATATLRSQFGSRLDSQYAPAVLARFGSGPLRVDVRIIAQQGVAALESAMRADQAERKATGIVLLRSGRFQAPAAVQSQLGAGQVDARLLITLTAMAARQLVRIDSFGGLGPGADSALPFLSADVSEAGRSASGQASDLKAVLSYLQQQRGRYGGATAQLLRPARPGPPVLRIAFTAPSPLGLLGPQAP